MGRILLVVVVIRCLLGEWDKSPWPRGQLGRWGRTYITLKVDKLGGGQHGVERRWVDEWLFRQILSESMLLGQIFEDVSALFTIPRRIYLTEGMCSAIEDASIADRLTLEASECSSEVEGLDVEGAGDSKLEE